MAKEIKPLGEGQRLNFLKFSRLREKIWECGEPSEKTQNDQKKKRTGYGKHLRKKGKLPQVGFPKLEKKKTRGKRRGRSHQAGQGSKGQTTEKRNTSNRLLN